MRWHLMCCHRVLVAKGQSGLVRGGEVRYGTCGMRLLVITVHVGGTVVVRYDLSQCVEIDIVRNGKCDVSRCLLLSVSRSPGLFERSG
jgi:hypothetical protein